MTLQEYITGLQEVLKERPELSTAIVVASSDDEGNNYREVCYGPNIGHFDDGSFYFESDDEEWEYADLGEDDVNAILIN